MREKHLLQDRIELLGAVRHSDVLSVSAKYVQASYLTEPKKEFWIKVLSQGSIFMNTSLTESFALVRPICIEAYCWKRLLVSPTQHPRTLSKHLLNES